VPQREKERKRSSGFVSVVVGKKKMGREIYLPAMTNKKKKKEKPTFPLLPGRGGKKVRLRTYLQLSRRKKRKRKKKKRAGRGLQVAQ